LYSTDANKSIAGTHTTGATTSLLFYHLLHDPEAMAKCVAEITENLPSLEPQQDAYPVAQVEASLPFLRDCMKENFRLTPVFTMPLARRIMDPKGLFIGDSHIPAGVCCPWFYFSRDEHTRSDK
jgi:cytochrome P450